MAQKTVLITGCSDGGIGSALAMAFQRRGYHVFATLRNRSRATALADLANVDIVDLDVLSTASINAAVNTVKKQTGGSLDVLVNNAGSSLVSPLLDVDPKQARRLFDLNFWAYLDMVQAFAPLLIAARGTVVNISSVGATMPVPWTGIYTATKGAVTSMSETLRLELEPLGVAVITAMVGTVQTSIFSKLDPVVLPPQSHYLPVKKFLEDINVGKELPKGTDPHKLADQIVGDVMSRASGKMWHGGSAWLAWFASRFFPAFLVDLGMRSVGRFADVKAARSSKL